MQRKDCAICKHPYFPEKEWSVQCVACYKKASGLDLLAGDRQMIFLQEEIRRLEQQPPQIKTKIIKQTQIDKRIVMQLIRLCHPDKHQNSPLSTKVTQWLLKQRRD